MRKVSDFFELKKDITILLDSHPLELRKLAVRDFTIAS